MMVTAWILFIFFGFFSFVITFCMFFDDDVNAVNMWMYMFYVTMTAIMAGVIWGGLFQ